MKPLMAAAALLAAVASPRVACASPSSRALAHRVLLRCAHADAFADAALAATLARHRPPPPASRHAAELVFGVLRHGRGLDFVLGRFASLERTDPPTAVALRIGAYELLHLRTADHAAVDEAVALGEGKRRRSFVNAVLRRIARERDSLPSPEDVLGSREAALGVATSVPDWLLAELGATHLPDFDELAAWARATHLRPRQSLRANRLVAPHAAALLAELREGGVAAEQACGVPYALVLPAASGAIPSLPGFERGAWSVQDLAAQLVGLLAAPSAGEVVLDLCAAPGGKTTHLAELMADSGTVIAVERRERKLKLIAAACERLRLASVRAYAADASDSAALLRLLRENGAAAADHVLLDAPCSGMGTLRRNPEHRYQSDEHLPQLVALQGKLLDAAAACVRPGGSLTYSVCSPLAREGVDRVVAFLETHPEFECPAIENAELLPFASACEALGGERRVLQTWTHLHPNCDSFFACRLQRRVKTSP